MWKCGHLSFLACIPGGEIPSKSELDELQEEVARRAQEQELRKKREKELEAAKGFNPHPSRFMDLDELQNQGNCCIRLLVMGTAREERKKIQAYKFPVFALLAKLNFILIQPFW